MDEVDVLDDARHQHHMRHRTETDKHLARMLWVVICSYLAIRLVQRGFKWRSRHLHPRRNKSRWRPTLALHHLTRATAYVKAICLISSSHFKVSKTHSLSPMQILLVVFYGCTIATLIISVDAPKFSSHFVDDIAFRAAWITLTQVPLVYLLATKRGPLNLLAGFSYERINWIHRWVGRILLLSATTHMAIMMNSISAYDIIHSEDKVMIIVRYGVGSYATVGWIALTSIFPLRKWSYRLFFFNHWISTAGLLWVLFKHVPRYARFPIYTAIFVVILDRIFYLYFFLKNNVVMRPAKKTLTGSLQTPKYRSMGLGHAVKMMMPIVSHSRVSYKSGCQGSLSGSTTIIRICKIPFSWRPGQHIRVYIPKLGILEVHPFTPATCSELSPAPGFRRADPEDTRLLSYPTSSVQNDMVLMIRSCTGLTRRLADYHENWRSSPCPNASGPSSSLTAFLDGPYGIPPAWEEYENLVLISTSTGVSFALSVMDYLEQLCFEGQTKLRTQRISFIWALRHLEPDFDAIVTDMISRNSEMLRDAGVVVNVQFYATCPNSEVVGDEVQDHDQFAHLRQRPRNPFASRPPLRLLSPDDFDLQGQYSDADIPMTNMSPSIVPSSSQSPLSMHSDQSSTLVDEDEMQSIASATIPKLDLKWSSCYRFCTSLFSRQRNKPPSSTDVCCCQLIRSHGQQKKPTKQLSFINRTYGARPNMSRILSTSLPPRDNGKSLVAVCSNATMTSDVKSAIARLNLDFALRKRKTNVALFTEGFG